MKPPRHALHGPFEYVKYGYERTEARDKITEQIDAGACTCACCKLSGKCEPIKNGHMWLRQPTPKAKREQPDRARMTSTWPVWLYEPIQWET